ncbi:MAG TPA: hypothetical protein ENJ02_07625 [Chloroflexi bacterium]|nr:hypothetical protein [Chloroflexota bacterium]
MSDPARRPSVPLIRALRRKRRGRGARLPLRRLGRGSALALTLALALTGLASAAGYAWLTYDLPSPEELVLLLDSPGGMARQPTRLYDRSGEHLLLILQTPAAANAPPLSADPQAADRFAPALITATLGSEDPGFWSHPGFTLGGAPSLAQHLARTLLLSEEPPGLRRDLRERLLAAQLTARYGRLQVLTWYLNSADYGRLAFGANAAAHVYLGKSARGLTLAEAALLTAIAQAPAINPFDAPALAQERARAVLDTLAQRGYITPRQAEQAAAAPLTLVPPTAPPASPAPEFAQRALQEAAASIGWEHLQRGGYRIRTTLDYDLQLQAQCAAQVFLARLGGGDLPQAVTFDGAPCEAARLLPALRSAALPEVPALSALLQDPRTGQILVWVDETPAGAESPLEGARSPGTLLTPVVYLAAFTRGFAPATLVWDIPLGSPEDPASPPLLDSAYDGPMRLRNALANDDLPPAVRIFYQTGAQTVWRTAAQLGLRSLAAETSPQAEALWRGGALTLPEIVHAFGILANRGLESGLPQGTEIRSTAVLDIRDRQGSLVLDNTSPAGRPVLDEGLAYLLTNTLSDEPARWRTLGHPNPLEIGRPAAAKLGQTVDRHDAWSAGYTPYLSAGVWVGDLTAAPKGQATPEAAAALWHALMQYASRPYPADAWPRPAEVSEVQVCDPSGLLPTPECPRVVSEVFLNGTEPTHADTLFRKLAVNRETGLLATVYTPPALVEERVYMLVPPEAAEWAAQAGLPTPPEAYDTIPPEASAAPGARIEAPENFAYVRGEVPIRGTAAGEGFVSYRLQAGSGLNPQEWLQIGEARSAPVEDGLLGRWDTTGLEGIYALQLVVMREDQHVDFATIQVTVDNQPPQVRILGLSEGERISQQERPQLLLQAEVSDNLQVSEVRFILNGQPLETRLQAPYQVAWQSRPGRYTLEVVATDGAGNEAKARLYFEVTR